jgi:hypothetical protein
MSGTRQDREITHKAIVLDMVVRRKVRDSNRKTKSKISDSANMPVDEITVQKR